MALIPQEAIHVVVTPLIPCCNRLIGFATYLRAVYVAMASSTPPRTATLLCTNLSLSSVQFPPGNPPLLFLFLHLFSSSQAPMGAIRIASAALSLLRMVMALALPPLPSFGAEMVAAVLLLLHHLPLLLPFFPFYSSHCLILQTITSTAME